jgi:outer membrane protein
LAACGVTHVQAQSLQELYLAAHDYDATYLASRAGFEAAGLRLAQAQGTQWPSVGLAASTGRSLSTAPAAVGTQVTQQVTNANASSATISGTQALYNRANDVGIAQARRAAELAHTDLEAAEQDLILRVSQAYFDVLAAQDNLATARASLAAISEQVASAKRNFEVGTATITDTREAQARFDLARFTQIQAQNDLLTKRIVLDQTVGRVNVAPRPLAVPVAVPALTPQDVNEWVARGDAEHPAVRRARLALDIARLETEKAKAGNLPTVTLNGSYGRTRVNADGSIATLPYNYAAINTSSSVGVTLNVPLFEGFQLQNRIRETLVLENQSLDNLDLARRSVAQATRTLYYSVGSDAAQVSALEAAESSSQLALEATQLGFKVGVRVNIDVLNAQAQLYTTQAQLAKARYDLIMAGLKLRQASGRLTADDVTAVNALLVR